MKKLRNITALGALVATAALAGPALSGVAAHTSSFTGKYKGVATEKVSGQAVTARAKGTGTGTVLGKGTITGTVTGTTANPPCSPFGGPGVMTGKGGTLKVKVTNARGCAASEEDQKSISISGTVKVLGGTGKFKAARGSFHFSGHYDRGNGSFNVKLTGTLKY